MINEAYATVTEANDYLEYQVGSEEWSELTDDDKEKYLVTATRQLERLKHKYESLDSTQTLTYPVDTGTDDDGLDAVKEANILQALYLTVNADCLQEAQASRIQGITQESIGPMSKVQNGFNPMTLFSPDAIQILAPYIDMTIRQTR